MIAPTNKFRNKNTKILTDSPIYKGIQEQKLKLNLRNLDKNLLKNRKLYKEKFLS